MADNNVDSILLSTKKLLGVAPEYTAFDTDIMIFINSVFSVLHNVGAAPVEGFAITGPNETWSQYIQDAKNVEMVKTYVYLKVRLLFDPPSTSFVLAAYEKTAAELEWRLNSLEHLFNPLAYGKDMTQLFVVSTEDDTPPEGLLGDVEFDPVTGNVYRQVP